MKCLFLIFICIHFFPSSLPFIFFYFLSVPTLLNRVQIFLRFLLSVSVPYSFRSSASPLSLTSSYFPPPPSLLVTNSDRGKQTVLIQFGNEVYKTVIRI